MDDLKRALVANRSDIELALESAREELSRCQARCRDIEEVSRRAEIVLGIQGGTTPTGADLTQVQMPLRAAMELVLRDEPNGMPPVELTKRIRDRGLYRRRDGGPVDVGQVHNRVHHSPETFVRDSGRIRLRRPGEQ